jgi:hypothetical protein
MSVFPENFKPALIIDPDEFKKKILNYNPAQAEEFHKQSVKMANKAFEDGIKSGNYDSVIFMCGGSASGKTEYINTQLLNQNVIIVDSTLSSIESLQIKMRK